MSHYVDWYHWPVNIPEQFQIKYSNIKKLVGPHMNLAYNNTAWIETKHELDKIINHPWTARSDAIILSNQDDYNMLRLIYL